MRIILSSNPYRDRGLHTALEAQRVLKNAGAETVMCFPFIPKKGERLDIPPQIELQNLEKELARADLLICFGGDGTILHTARDAALHDVPILGVNMGSVGFMAELERSELKLLPRLLQQPFRTQSRMMLEVKTFRGGRQLSEDLALNDAVISKGSMARVAELEVWADQTALCSLTGDGVVVATHRLHRLFHVRGRANRGTHLQLLDYHPGLRPSAGGPAYGAGPGPGHYCPPAQREPQGHLSVCGRGEVCTSERRRARGNSPCQAVCAAGAADPAEFLSGHS